MARTLAALEVPLTAADRAAARHLMELPTNLA
jgi:hypothetical protein